MTNELLYPTAFPKAYPLDVPDNCVLYADMGVYIKSAACEGHKPADANNFTLGNW